MFRSIPFELPLFRNRPQGVQWSNRVAARVRTAPRCNTRRLRVAIVANAVAAALALWTVPGVAQELTPVEVQSIAREAYIYGFPMVENYRMMYASAIDRDSQDFAAPFNTLQHEANVFTAADTDVVTPNADVVVSLLWMDLRTQPIVLSVPEIEPDRYYSIQLIDLFNFTFSYIGTRTTGNDTGSYLIAGPNWQGEVPQHIDGVIRCETEFAMALYRTQLRGPEDLPDVKRIQAQYTVRTLSALPGQPRPDIGTEIPFPPPALATEPGIPFFSTLGFLLPFCPPPAAEAELMAQFARIGLTAGKPFDANGMSPEFQEALQLGMAEGDSTITAAAATLKVAEVIGTREYLKSDYLKRAVAAKVGHYSNAKEEALYPLYLTDAEGQSLDGHEADYVMKFGPDDLPPVNAFWSLTAYDNGNQALVPNPMGRYRISSSMLPTLTRDADGGLTLYLQNGRPQEEQASNWLPVPPRPFYLVMRLYWPKPEGYDGTWAPPLIWKTNEAPTAAPSNRPVLKRPKKSRLPCSWKNPNPRWNARRCGENPPRYKS